MNNPYVGIGSGGQLMGSIQGVAMGDYRHHQHTSQINTAGLSIYGTARDAANDDMHPVVELILARMESNPEEFTDNHMWWVTLINQYRSCMTSAEKQAVDVRLGRIHMDEMHRKAMDRLLVPENETKVEYAVTNYTAQQLALIRAAQNTQNAAYAQQAANLQNYNSVIKANENNSVTKWLTGLWK